MSNKKAQAFRNKNHLDAQTQSNTSNLQSLGNLVIPLSAKVFDLEKQIQRLEYQLREAKVAANLAEYKAIAIQRILNLDGYKIRSEIVNLQKEDFKLQSEGDDKVRNLITVDGPAANGQIALVAGKVFKADGTELQNEEIIGSKLNLGDDDLYKGIDEQIIGMNVGETKKIEFKVGEQDYFMMLTLDGLRTLPAQAEDSKNEEANQAN